MENILMRVPLFQHLSVDDARTEAAACELRRFQKGDVIFQEGRPAERFAGLMDRYPAFARRVPRRHGEHIEHQGGVV